MVAFTAQKMGYVGPKLGSEPPSDIQGGPPGSIFGVPELKKGKFKRQKPKKTDHLGPPEIRPKFAY